MWIEAVCKTDSICNLTILTSFSNSHTQIMYRTHALFVAPKKQKQPSFRNLSYLTKNETLFVATKRNKKIIVSGFITFI